MHPDILLTQFFSLTKEKKTLTMKENVFVLFKAQLRELFLEILICVSSFCSSFFSAKPALKSPNPPALKWAKPALKGPRRHFKKEKENKTSKLALKRRNRHLTETLGELCL